MGRETQNYKTDYISQDYYSYLVDLRRHCNQLHTKLQFENNTEIQQEFKQYMTLLIKEMKPKYVRREDMDVPKQLQNQEPSGMNTNELDEVLKDIAVLQEKLGITSTARKQYEVEKLGAENKNGDRNA